MAQAHLEQAAKLDPKNGEVDYLNGVLLQRWQQTQKACDAYASAVEKNPTELSYLLPQAEMLVQLNKAADALKLLQDKTSAFEHSGVIRDEIGQILVQQKRYGQAVVVLREARVLSSDDAGIREHLAFALLDDQQYAEASDVLGRLLKQSGFEKRADLFEALGQSQSQTNDPGEARSSYEQATQIAPGVSGYWVGLAKVATQQGDLPGADAAVRKAISLDPTSARAPVSAGIHPDAGEPIAGVFGGFSFGCGTGSIGQCERLPAGICAGSHGAKVRVAIILFPCAADQSAR